MKIHARLFPATLAALAAAAAPTAQERLFRPLDRDARQAAATELQHVLSATADLETTIATAAIAGTRLPGGSHAARELRDALGDALTGEGPAASRRLRSDLGDLIAVLTFEPLIEAEMPEGFPPIGVVGELEVREYPAYRMARAEMRRGSSSAFWPLFRHIESNDIAMTTPVQMDWNESANGDGAADGRPIRMAFLYGDPRTAPDRTADGIDVVTVEPVTVLSLGAIGEDRRARVDAMRARMTAFLAEAGCVWEAAGAFRTMSYNSPMVRRDRRYFELQIPVRRRSF